MELPAQTEPMINIKLQAATPAITRSDGRLRATTVTSKSDPGTELATEGPAA